jgi:hypothetical protein
MTNLENAQVTQNDFFPKPLESKEEIQKKIEEVERDLETDMLEIGNFLSTYKDEDAALLKFMLSVSRQEAQKRNNENQPTDPSMLFVNLLMVHEPFRNNLELKSKCIDFFIRMQTVYTLRKRLNTLE